MVRRKRPILRGRDIKQYGFEWADLWLINTHNGVRPNIPRIDINEYPAIKAHLDDFFEKLAKRADKGETPYNLRNCAYLEDFSKPKIIFQEIVQESQFMMDQHGTFFCNDTGRIIVGENLYHILGVMNSKLFFYAIKQFYGGGALGDHGVRMKHTFFENFPCLSYSENIDSLSRKAVCSPDSNIIEELDNYIFDQYNLNEEEISLILNDSD